MIVVLKQIREYSWVKGINKYRNCHEDLAPYLTRTGRIYTGLTKEDETRLGDLLGLDLKPTSKFWEDFFVRVGVKDVYLNTEDPMDEMRYLFLKNHKRVKASIFENKASANYVLVNKDEEAKKLNMYSRLKREAAKAFDVLSPDDMRKCLRLFGHNGDTMNNEVVERTLFDIVEANPQSFIDRWVNNKSKDTEVIIERSISKNIIRRNKNIYKYGSEIIGHSMEDTIAYLTDPKNQDLKIAIMQQLEAKMSISLMDDMPIEDTRFESQESKAKVSDLTDDPSDIIMQAVTKKGKKNNDTI